ncbi:outer membrane protein OmpU [Roseicyclus mahoneyensis]|uniref:Outer membrane protein OmpU n=2 Tax=Roseicyclus mahoneyensis TaxID=164332 RepID=A0A316GK73_9RHOB|nr:outer membrane protein OmpU [Roseicyclus mahoneyensis]
MGIAGGADAETVFFQSVDVRFRLTGETDNGLSFGATIDLDDAIESGAGSTRQGLVDVDGGTADFTVFIRGAFGTLTMGDTDGAFDWAMTEVNAGSPGSINDAETGHAGFNGNSGYDGGFNGQVLRYDYSIGDLGVAVSAEIDETGADDAILGLGFRYGFDFAGGSLALGLGYQDSDTAPDAIIGISASVELDTGLTATVNYSQLPFDVDHVGLGASYEFDAFTVHANWGRYDTSLGDTDGFGLAASYDLGGGASLHLGYGDGEVLGVDAGSTWSLGVAMSF